MSFFKNQNGQTLIEASIVIVPLFFILKSFLFVIFIFGQSFWIDHKLYQHLICLAEGRGLKCEMNLKKNFKMLNAENILEHLKIVNNNSTWFAKTHLDFYGIQIDFQQSFRMPDL